LEVTPASPLTFTSPLLPAPLAPPADLVLFNVLPAPPTPPLAESRAPKELVLPVPPALPVFAPPIPPVPTVTVCPDEVMVA